MVFLLEQPELTKIVTKIRLSVSLLSLKLLLARSPVTSLLLNAVVNSQPLSYCPISNT